VEQLAAPRQVLATGARQHQRAHAVGVADAEDLGDHPAHGCPHHVGPLDAEVVEHGHRVTGHDLEVVGACGLVGSSDPAVVEGDGVEAAHRSALAHPPAVVGPEPLHQQQRLAVGVAEGLVVDPDPVLTRRERHGASVVRLAGRM
jgi:hypothetical protein